MDADNPLVTPEPSPSPKMSAGQLILFLLNGAWITGWSIAAQAGFTVMNELLFEEFQFNRGQVVLAVTAGYLLLVGIPVLLFILFQKNPRLRGIYLSLAMGILLGICFLPTRLAGYSDSQLAALLQIAGGMVFLFGFTRYRSKKDPHPSGEGIGHSTLINQVLILAALDGIPWLLWGALGSPLDTLLELAAAGTIGFALANIFCQILLSGSGSDPQMSHREILLRGAAANLLLLIVSTTAAHNNLNLLLALSLPSAAWEATALADGANAGTHRSSILPLGLFFTLTAAFPMLLIDPDELALTITLGKGELIQWTALAAGVGILIQLVLTILVWATRRRTGFSFGKLGWKGAGAVGVLCALLYGFSQPGFYGENLFVILKDQADLSSASELSDPSARRTQVFNVLTKEAETSQAELRKTLNLLHVEYQPYYLVNALEINGGPLMRLWLQSRPEVDLILDSPHLRPLPQSIPEAKGEDRPPQEVPWNLTLIGADQVWTEFHVTGEGVVIGNSDTGVDGTHRELSAQYRGTVEGNDYNWFDPWNGTTAPVDSAGHGTHTTGTILGKSTGVAPGVQWIGCVNLARNLGNPGYYLDCMQFMLAPFPEDGDPFHDGKPERGAQILNNSWGCPEIEGCDADVFLPAVKALRTAGIFVEASAGNSGYTGCGSVRDPIAIYQEVFTTGAIDSNGQLTSFSSVGPVIVDGSQRIKPDLVAPGAGILSTFPGGTYSSADGTSMAGPHTVGVVALMWSANPALIGDIDLTEQILQDTATPYQGAVASCSDPAQIPNASTGYGILNAYAAVKEAIAMGQ